MNKKEDFVDKLMNRAFDLPAPEMPDFKCKNQDTAIENWILNNWIISLQPGKPKS